MLCMVLATGVRSSQNWRSRQCEAPLDSIAVGYRGSSPAIEGEP